MNIKPFVQVTLVQTKETKNMVRYDAPGGEELARQANVPNIYLRKTALASAFGGFPDKITITIEKTE